MMDKLINAFVVVLVGVILTPVIFQVASGANVTGITLTVITLIPTLFALAVLIVAVRGMRQGGQA